MLIPLVFVFLSLSHSAFMQSQMTRKLRNPPECREREPCRVGVLGGLEFCRCSNQRSCPSPNSVQHSLSYHGIGYQFCEPLAAEIPQCGDGELAIAKSGFRQQLYCACPESLVLRSIDWDPETDRAEYVCQRANVCDSSNDTCGVRFRALVSLGLASHLRSICDCPDESVCLETGKSEPHKENKQVMVDYFQCIPTAADDHR